jgi:ABC-2 type transport system ATP-binding protein
MTAVVESVRDSGSGLGPAIEVSGLEMDYRGRPALRGIDLAVGVGEIFALLGPNGAGKTTTVEILEGYRSRTAGRVRVLGEDPATAGAAWRDRIGVVLQSCVPEPELTVVETLQLYAGFHFRPLGVEHVLELVGLTDSAGTRNERLSGGQQRRLDFALALIGDPDLIFLDEPTTGFDPGARRLAWQVISGLRQLGKTIVLTTHYLEEAEVLADRIAVIAGGLVVAEGTPATIADRHLSPTVIRVEASRPFRRRSLPAELSRLADIDGAALCLSTNDPVRHLHRLCGWMLDNGIEANGIDVRRPDLEDIYLDLTGGPQQ